MLKQSSHGNHAALSEFDTKIASEVAIWRDAEWSAMRVGYETYLSDFDDRELMHTFQWTTNSVDEHVGDHG